MITIHHIADYFIRAVETESGDELTPLKLQKLAYYAQAWYLALFDKPLFDGEFQAWPHGPANHELYVRFKDLKYNPIQLSMVRDDTVDIPDELIPFLNEVWDVFGKYSAKALESMTHEEDPWIEARNGLSPEEPSTAVISNDSMKTYYRTLMQA